MTRDAKIGMLTGLGVIVLIGVMLSNYLGDPHAMLPGYAGGTTGSGATGAPGTGSMAVLPLGAQYRKEITEPAAGAVGVPGMGPGGPDGAGQISTTNGIVPPTAFAVDNGTLVSARTAAPVGSNGPTVSGPVSPIPVGPIGTFDAKSVDSGPPVIMLAENSHPAAVQTHETASVTPATPASTTYEIVAGDTLAKIARKFYNSSKNSDVERIVAANPGVLKDATTSLMVSKKLVIPGVAPVVVAKAAPAAPKKVDASDVDGILVPLPGDMNGRTPGNVAPTAKVEAPKKAATGVYVVQSGDTLEKIAKKLAPNKSTEMVQKLISLNGIKDPHGLQQGAKLKTPA